MKSTAFIPWALLASSLAGSAISANSLSSVKRVTNLPTVANKFIVEVDALSDVKRSGVTPHELLYSSLRRRGVGFTVNKEFDSEGLFVGAALTLSSAQDATNLLNTPGVKAIRPVVKFSRPQPVASHVVTGLDDSTIPSDSESTHVLTGVDKLHAQGIAGKGIKVGILDTGIDYTHPALGGGFGPGFKVSGGTDLVGDDYTGANTPVPDPDPLDQCAGHGTHVAGIIGANPGNEFNISGVAYEASISAYRIFGCTGFVTDDVIIEALLLGVQDGQDILTLSLGGSDGWTESSSSTVASRIAAYGKIVTIAAGNDGGFGSWFTSSPGNGIDVISVASLDNTVVPLQNATVSGVAHDPITYFSALPLNVTTPLPIYATSNDTTVVDDACDPLPDNTPDLSSFLVIVRRGTCTFVQKLTNIAAKGATTAFIYDNGNGFASISTGDFPIVALIQAADGAFLVDQYAAGAKIVISFPQTGASYNLPDPSGGLISSFSSYGPTEDFFFKPAIAAPGGNILSTFPVPLGSWAVLSGTSMATPFLAGSAALLFGAKGNSATVGRTARTLFQTTAQKVPSSHTDGDPLQTVTQQGAGLINTFNAIHTTTIVSPAELILNDTAHFASIQEFTIHNAGTTPKSFKLTHVPAGTAVTVIPGTIFAEDGPVPLTADKASVTFSRTTFTVFPGQTQTIFAHITPPKAVDATTFPVFSGFIDITSATEILHVTYLGLAAALKDKQVIDDTDEFFGVPLPAILDSVGDLQVNATNYTFVGDDFPTVLFRLAFGTPTIRVDLVDPSIKFTPTLNRRSFGAPLFTFPSPAHSGSFAQVKTLGSLLEFVYVPRDSDDPTTGFNTVAITDPAFANGTQIPNGSYRALIRALRVTGDPTKEADYESWLSPIIGIDT